MVLYFTSNVVNPAALIYMGKDKFENEDLIKHGWPEDVWFHVDKLSSAHVYLRLPKGQTWDNISQPLLDDLAQLCKANSIEGNKKNNISIIYTPWSNLLKRGDMATGQVSFKNQKSVKRVHVEARENAIVNRLNKTKREEDPDLAFQRMERDKEEARVKKNEMRKIMAEERKVAEQHRIAKDNKDYGKMFEKVRKENSNAPVKVSEDIFGDDNDEYEDYDANHTKGRFDDDFSDLL
ncbi:Coiled-coil domain-containing protein 25 [Coemansia sp. RSA 988]|nr:Coiled-coil domain-containing protein 25 [Coemansia sp. RSA 988]